MVILPDRIDQVRTRAAAGGPERMQPFAQLPAVVAALDNQVDLLIEILAHIRRPELASLLVESHAPDIAQAIRVNLRLHALPADERVIIWNGVFLAGFLA